MTPKPGQTARDRDADDDADGRVFIVRVHDTRADEFTITYDYNKNPITVYNYEDANGAQPNKKYPADDRVVEVVYLETLKDRDYDWMQMDTADLQHAVDTEGLTEYHFPESRLAPIE